MLRNIAKRLFGKPSEDWAPSVDAEYSDVLNGRIDVFGALRSGQVVLVRNIEPIKAGRLKMIELAGPKAAPELELFYRTGAAPSLDALHGLSHAIKDFRSKRLWSRLFHDFFSAMKLPDPTLYDGGIPRLVLPLQIVDAAKASGRFEGTDFQRATPAGLSEIFMPAPANIHRDFNRPHHLFQFNMWFPLHDADADGILRVYPHLYREPIFDQNCTPEALAALGKHAEFTLAFGDAVLFHGEQLHTSPIASSGGRRQSVDFRVAVDCHDDNGHYRQGFLSSRNFDVVPGVGSAIDLIIELEGTGGILDQRRHAES
ncbi:hypothetical protein [Bradyrhizobium sp. DOA1]|uniref:hypothetical protein n=1 Tax=Bradyrhizobium sp. DOA1 TaxID=1126616 RepID=UPI00077CD28A|nr:hypothetical protein [Bradyrhizobium sp. DOA1]